MTEMQDRYFFYVRSIFALLELNVQKIINYMSCDNDSIHCVRYL